MATDNFTRERKKTWATSSLPGPPGPFPPTLRYKRSLPLHDAGTFTRLLTRQCLHLLHDLTDEIEAGGWTAHRDGRRSGERICAMTPRMRLLFEMLRAGLERDPSVSVGQVVRTLRTFKEDMLCLEATLPFRHW